MSPNSETSSYYREQNEYTEIGMANPWTQQCRTGRQRNRGADRSQRNVFAQKENRYPDQRDNQHNERGEQGDDNAAGGCDPFAAFEAEPNRVIVAKDTCDRSHHTGNR